MGNFQGKESRPWLDHPDGKWSPRPQLPMDCPVCYEPTEPNESNVGPWELAGDPIEEEVQVGLVELWSLELKISVKNVTRVPNWAGVKSMEDLHLLHIELQKELARKLPPPPLVCTSDWLHLPTALWSYHAKETCLIIQAWLLEILQQAPTSSAVRDFFAPALNSYCHVLCLPLATHISEFLSEPLDLTNLFRLSSKAISETSRQIVAWQWERVFREKWPVHYEALCYNQAKDWEILFQQTVHGRREEILEIFDREKKVGFCMSAMTAKVSWEQKTRCYVASYVSASHVVPERIPTSEVHRLRFCPPNVRDQLQPELAPPRVSEIYAFRVYAGLEGLQVGRGVELQWKMQVGSPFGWWHGVVEHVERKGATAAVTLTFGHFPQHSRWYRLRVVVGDGVMRRCGIGGYHGGIRSCTAAEEKHWMRFFPKELVTF
ncbi:unnamed protein product [Effrenium voratum]|uniref:Uncharacterized protein n=1 Tax=Effrenium voratum TaxID=2562239 RepID=A0AA36I637_9DINO|nr:unnamed protein product [Effrenium voratum]CAJ1453498.1 unnamed protein product [Effrenium voratum]